MATRKTLISEENELSADRSELVAQLPISVGNSAVVDSLAIDQSHMEEFATGEEKSAGARYGRPPRGIYFNVLEEPDKPFKNRAFYFLLEIEGRDPYIIAPNIAKQKWTKT